MLLAVLLTILPTSNLWIPGTHCDVKEILRTVLLTVTC